MKKKYRGHDKCTEILKNGRLNCERIEDAILVSERAIIRLSGQQKKHEAQVPSSGMPRNASKMPNRPTLRLFS